MYPFPEPEKCIIRWCQQPLLHVGPCDDIPAPEPANTHPETEPK